MKNNTYSLFSEEMLLQMYTEHVDEIRELERELDLIGAALDALNESEDEEPYCTACNGTGEGQYDGSRCRGCNGSGVERREED